MQGFTLRVVTDHSTIMTLTLDKNRKGIRLEQGFDGIWDAQGLRKPAGGAQGCGGDVGGVASGGQRRADLLQE